MNKKKIVITIDWFLPGTLSGGPVRSYANLIAHLKDDFEFYIITRNTDFGSDESYANIEPNTWIAFNAYTKVYYIVASDLNSAHLKDVMNSIPFDLAFVNGIYSWYFSILPVYLLKKTQKPIIVSARGMLNPQAFSVKGRKKKIYLTLARLFKIYSGVSFHATNADEATCIKNEIGQSAVVRIAPNLPRKLDKQLKTSSQKAQPVKFVNVARISIEKGTLKTLEGLQGVTQPLLLDLYGPIYDKAYWNKCEEVISKLPKHIKVAYKGVLESEDVPATLTHYDFFVLLSEGENFGHAILEALSVGLPVIISNRTPWKDLEPNRLGWDINTAHKENIEEAFSRAAELSDADYSKWSQAAYTYAKAFIENPEWVKQNKALFLNVLKT
jgi:glycosyltransferase involved in cell wall biosynthesis